MKGLLNLLTALAALLNLTTGCGLRSGGNPGQRLLRIGAALATQRLATTNTGATLGGVLGGSSAGSLLGTIGGGVLGSGLVSGTTELTSNSASSGAGTRLTEIGTGLRGVPGGVLLSGLGNLAVERLSSRISSGGSLSGSRISGSGAQSGILLRQVLQQPSQLAAEGFIAAAGATTSSATRVTTNLAQSSGTLNVPSQGGGSPHGVSSSGGSGTSSGYVVSGVRGVYGATAGGLGPGAGAPSLSSVGAPGATGLNGVSSSPGSLPGASNFGPGGSSMQRIPQGVDQMGQSISTASLMTSSTVANSASRFGQQLMGNVPRNAQGVIPSLGGAIPAAGASNGGRGPGSSGVVSGPGFPINGNSRHGHGQGFPQTSRMFAGGLAAVGSAVATTTRLTTNLGANTNGNTVNVAESPGGMVPSGGASNGGPGFGPSVVASGLGNLAEQGLGQDTRLIGQTLPGGIIGHGSSAIQSTAGMATRIAGSSRATLLNAASSLGDVPGGGTPGVGIGADSSGGGTGNNPEQRLGQGVPEPSDVLAGTFVGRTSPIQQSTSSGTQLSGSFRGGSPGQGPVQGAQPMSQVPGGVSHVTVTASSHSASTWRAQTHIVRGSAGSSGGGLPSLGSNLPGGGAASRVSGFGSTSASSGTNLLGHIVAASTAQHSVGGPAALPSNSFGGLVSSSASVSGSSSAIAGIRPHGQLQPKNKMSTATAAGIALGVLSGALTIGAVGAGIAGALNSNNLGGGRRYSGCPGTGCSSGCGRKRRSVGQSKVPAEVLNRIPMNFDRLY